MTMDWVTLANLNNLAQIAVAITAVVGAILLYFEYDKSKKYQRMDLSLSALKNWDESISEYTAPAIRLIENHRDNKDILEDIRFNRAIKLQGDLHLSSAYGFLIENGEISGEKVNVLRFAVMRYLNAWENVAYLYKSGRADREIIEQQFHEKLGPKGRDFFAIILPFMNIFSSESWKPFRDMIADMPAEAASPGKEPENSASGEENPPRKQAAA